MLRVKSFASATAIQHEGETDEAGGGSEPPDESSKINTTTITKALRDWAARKLTKTPSSIQVRVISPPSSFIDLPVHTYSKTSPAKPQRVVNSHVSVINTTPANSTAAPKNLPDSTSSEEAVPAATIPPGTLSLCVECDEVLESVVGAWSQHRCSSKEVGVSSEQRTVGLYYLQTAPARKKRGRPPKRAGSTNLCNTTGTMTMSQLGRKKRGRPPKRAGSTDLCNTTGCMTMSQSGRKKSGRPPKKTGSIYLCETTGIMKMNTVRDPNSETVEAWAQHRCNSKEDGVRSEQRTVRTSRFGAAPVRKKRWRLPKRAGSTDLCNTTGTVTMTQLGSAVVNTIRGPNSVPGSTVVNTVRGPNSDPGSTAVNIVAVPNPAAGCIVHPLNERVVYSSAPVFKCPDCECPAMQSRHELSTHRLANHLADVLATRPLLRMSGVCLLCRPGQDHDLLEEHTVQCHGAAPQLTCLLCLRLVGNASALSSHMWQQHHVRVGSIDSTAKGYTTCSECGMQCTDLQHRMEHQDEAHNRGLVSFARLKVLASLIEDTFITASPPTVTS